MFLQLFISFAILSGLGNAQDLEECTELAAAGNCDFYPECVNTKINCATDKYEYALSYGEVYCDRFESSLCFRKDGVSSISITIYVYIHKLLIYNTTLNVSILSRVNSG